MIDLEKYGWKLSRAGYWKHPKTPIVLLEMEGGTFLVDVRTDWEIVHIKEVFAEDLELLFKILRLECISN